MDSQPSPLLLTLHLHVGLRFWSGLNETKFLNGSSPLYKLRLLANKPLNKEEKGLDKGRITLVTKPVGL